MTKVLIAYASRHGSTRGIAERLTTILSAEGLTCRIAPVEADPDPSLVDACILGSGVYMGGWLKEGIDYAWRHSGMLAERPVWLFSSGPLPTAATQKGTDPNDPLAAALGPADGPGSGGRKKIAELSAAIHPRDHRVFFGAYDPKDPPKSMPERLVRMLPHAGDILPAGDFRDWPVIESWAHELARELHGTLVAVG
ncbi:MAG: flavodoxin domain-containing protein [Chloroflexota bacterium]